MSVRQRQELAKAMYCVHSSLVYLYGLEVGSLLFLRMLFMFKLPEDKRYFIEGIQHHA